MREEESGSLFAPFGTLHKLPATRTVGGQQRARLLALDVLNSEEPLNVGNQLPSARLIAAESVKLNDRFTQHDPPEGFKRPRSPRSLVIFAQEVLADWTARKILQPLEYHNWQLVLGANKGQSVLRYTNQGFRARAG